MAFRFRKSLRILPGVRLNFGKKSVGVSVGNKWGGVTFNSRNGTTYRASVPGTGASFTHTDRRGGKSGASQSGAPSSPPPAATPKQWLVLAAIVVACVWSAISEKADRAADSARLMAASAPPVSSYSAPAEPVEAAELAPFVAPENSNVYHASDCPALEGKNSANFSQFLTAEAAAEAGFYPHSLCLPEDAATPIPAPSHAFVASRYSDKYHIKGCPHAAYIDPENIRYFSSNAEAEGYGYTPCSYCMG